MPWETSSWINPICEVLVPHTHRKDQEGHSIPVYVRLPTTSHQARIPTTILFTDADRCRADYSSGLHEAMPPGRGCIILETPGTGDCPSEPTDPDSLPRLWRSLISWMHKQGVFDMDGIHPRGPDAAAAHPFNGLVLPHAFDHRLS
jgi:hypothetical protein